MTIRVVALGLVIFAAACAKTTNGTETGNPPAITAKLVMVEDIGEDRVRVSGEEGAITPGGGEVTVTNTSRDGEPVVGDVAQDGSFEVELEGAPDDDYEVVASNEAGKSPAKKVSGGPPAPGDWKTLHPCDDADPMDPLIITELRIEGDTLHASVEHGGGCEEHAYGLCYGDAWRESDPIQVGFKLLHDSGGDLCDAQLHEELSFDLTPFKDAYEDAYQTGVGAAYLGFDSCTADVQPGQDSCSVLYEWGDGTSECGPPIGAACPAFDLPAAPASWVVHETKCMFSFRGPAGAMNVDVQGTDSCVDQFESDGCTFHAGAGGFSNGLTEFEGADELVVGRAAIQGFEAKVVTAFRRGEPRPYIAGAHFPDPPFQQEPDTFGVSADLLIVCDTREQRDAALPALGTVRFE